MRAYIATVLYWVRVFPLRPSEIARRKRVRALMLEIQKEMAERD